MSHASYSAVVVRATLLAFALLTAAGTAAAATDRATAERLMRDSGLWDALASVPTQLRQGQAAALAGQQVSPETIERITALAVLAFDAGRLRTTVAERIAAGTAQADVPAILAWYGSEPGIAITRLEVQSAADERDPEESVRAASALLGTLPGSRRAQLVDLVQASRAAEGLSTILIDTTVAIQLGVASTAPGGPVVSAAELRGALEAQRPQLLSQFAQLALVLYAKTYEGVSDADLGRYLVFLRSDAGRRFTAVSVDAYGAALVKAAADFGRSLPMARDSART